MKKFLAAMGLGLVLASCSTVSKLSPSVVYDLGNAYGILQASAIAYTKLPRCSATVTVACSKASVVVALAQYDKNAISALTVAENYVRNPTSFSSLTLTGVITGAQTAITAFQTFETSVGVK